MRPLVPAKVHVLLGAGEYEFEFGLVAVEALHADDGADELPAVRGVGQPL